MSLIKLVDIARVDRIGRDLIGKPYVKKYAQGEWCDYIDGFTYIGVVYDCKSCEIGFKYYPADGVLDANEIVTLSCPLWVEDLETFTDEQIIKVVLELEAQNETK